MSLNALLSPIRVLTMMFVILCCATAGAQLTTADLVGSVTDTTSAAVPNAHVELRDVDRNIVRKAEADGSGAFTFALLPAGHYELKVTGAGFSEVDQRGILLNAGDRQRFDLKLQVGSSEQITVTSAPPAMNTDTSALSTQVGERQIEDLPLNGRNIVQLAQLSAGANEGTNGSIGNGARPDDRRQSSTVVANAQSDTLNNQLVEGVDNNETTIGTIGVRPSVEAIAEFRVSTNLLPAEVGRTPGAVINLITRAGTNALHGSAYEFFRNDVFDARNFFATPVAVPRKPEYRQNQYGGSLGGPIFRDKTFFFADYEGLRIIQGQLINNTVPTAYEVGHPGDFTDRGGPLLAASAISPIGAQFFALFPAPNNGTFYTSANPIRQNGNTVDARVDHKFSPSDFLFARWTYNTFHSNIPSALPTVNGVEPGGGAAYPGVADQNAEQWLLDYTRVLTPRMTLEFKAGYTYISNVAYPLNYGKYLGNAFGIPGANPDIYNSALPQIGVTGYTSLGDSTALPLFDRDNNFQYAAAATYARGHHLIKFGATFIRRQLFNEQPNPTASYSFNTTPNPTSIPSTIAPLVNLLEGNVYSVSRSVQLYPRYYRWSEPSAYLQDDWHVGNKLTLNLGLRYDIFTPFAEKFGHISVFDVPSGTFRTPATTTSTSGIQTYYKSIAPRMGFAWSPRSGTVLRGGYGLIFYRDASNPASYFANPDTYSVYSPNINTTTLATPFPAFAAGSLTNPQGTLRGMQQDYANSLANQFNLDLEQSFPRGIITSIAYVGSKGGNNRISQNVNLAPIGITSGSFATQRPYYTKFPGVTDITNFTSNGFSNYNALQASVRRQVGALNVQANYTWAHALSDYQTYSFGNLITPVPANQATFEYGASELDLRHRFALMATYEIALGDHARSVKTMLTRGWHFNAIDVWQSGQPFSIGNSSARTNTGVGGDRPNQTGTPIAVNPTISHFFDTSVYVAQPLGTLGNVRRNSVYGPHFRHFDASVFKDFPITERVRFQLRAEAFNVSNTPNFNQPGSTLGTSTFGVITSTRVGSNPRQFQFAGRFSF